MLDDRSVVIVSGPGGVGKGTVVAALLARDSRLWLSRSWTTRPRRPGEPVDAYQFVDRSTFEAKIADGGFFEWVEFLDYLQGTPVLNPPRGSDVVMEINVCGARKVKEQVPGAVLVFVDAPSPEEQRARMVRRGDSESTINARLAKAATERSAALEMGYEIVVNDDLDLAISAIEALIVADRRRLGSLGALASGF